MLAWVIILEKNLEYEGIPGGTVKSHSKVPCTNELQQTVVEYPVLNSAT